MTWMIHNNIITHNLLPNVKITFFDEHFIFHLGEREIKCNGHFTVKYLVSSILHNLNYCGEKELILTVFENYHQMKSELYEMLYKINPNYCDTQYDEIIEIIQTNIEPIYVHKYKDVIVMYIEKDYSKDKLPFIFYKTTIYDEDTRFLIKDKFYDTIMNYVFPLGPKSANKLV